MNGIDIEKTIAKYTNTQTVLYPVQDGGDVIGQEVDADNRLIYVIRKSGVISLAYAEETKVFPIIVPVAASSQTVTRS